MKAMATDLRHQKPRKALSERIKHYLHQRYLLKQNAMPRDWQPERGRK